MLRLLALLTLSSALVFACADPPAEGEGDDGREGEGDVVAEGEGDVSEGEGDIAEGEGDVVVGEGEGDVVVGEGEGDVVAGEGEGEGEANLALRLVTISDWHGQVEPLKVRNAGGTDDLVGGAPALAAYFAAERTDNPNTLTLTAGDAFGGSPPLASFFNEEPAVRALRLMGIDADTLGNHNFDKGTAHLADMVDLAGSTTEPGTPYVTISSNLTGLAANGLAAIEAPFHLVDVDGVSVALIGITNDDADALTFPGRMGTLTIEPSIAAANTARTAALAAGADVVIALVHLGATGVDGAGEPTGPLLDFARGVTGFAAVVGDHTDIQVNEVINGAVVVENRSKGATYSRVDLVINRANGAVVSQAVTVVQPLVANVTPVAAVDDMLAPFRTQLAAQLDRKIGTATDRFDRGNNVERLGEVAIGDLVADTLRDACGSAIALENGGGIRDKLPGSYAPVATNLSRTTAPFDLVVGDAFAVLPFGNYVVCREVTGTQLRAALEHGLSQLPAANGRFPQVAGINVVFDVTRAAGSRVVTLQLENGSAVVDTDSYSFATTDFLNLGGDGYTMLNDGTGTNLIVAADALVSFIEARATLTPVVGTRLRDISQVPTTPTIAPATLTLAARPAASLGFVAHSGVFTLNLPAAAGVGGVTFDVVSSNAAVVVPPTLTVAAGASSLTFRVRTTSSAALSGVSVTATQRGGAAAVATVNVVAAAAAPGAADLTITEVLADPPGSVLGDLDGDYNCDGARDGSDDEFFEVKNVSARAVSLDGVGVWDATAFTGNAAPRSVFAPYVLGPGETVAVFAGGDPLADTSAGPWCDSLLSSDGDVIALGDPLALNNDGDTVRLTATATSTSTLLASFTFGTFVDMSAVLEGSSVVGYTAAVGHLADRVATPSTNTDGSNQAAVDAN